MLQAQCRQTRCRQALVDGVYAAVAGKSAGEAEVSTARPAKPLPRARLNALAGLVEKIDEE